eukprot:c23990_g6_i1 orf=520-741(+)
MQSPTSHYPHTTHLSLHHCKCLVTANAVNLVNTLLVIVYELYNLASHQSPCFHKKFFTVSLVGKEPLSLTFSL